MTNKLIRTLNIKDAVFLGLGSIIGSGAYVAIGFGVSLSNGLFPLVVLLAASLALLNGLSLAQLSKKYPTSGGTYEFARNELGPKWGQLAGWSFLIAKMASAATATSGLANYLMNYPIFSDLNFNIQLVSFVLVSLITFSIIFGIKKTSLINIVLVSTSLIALIVFCIESSILSLNSIEIQTLGLSPSFSYSNFFNAIALTFVGFTGYGRIATLGEEIQNPKKSIPQSIVITLIVSAILYIALGVSISNLNTENLWELNQKKVSLLEELSISKNLKYSSHIISIGAMAALFGVLLNLILGMSRVVFAMSRNGELPLALTKIKNSNPVYATLAVSMGVLILTIFFSIQTTWKFSALSILIYYSLTHLSAIKQNKSENRATPLWMYLGLSFCVFLLLPFYF